MGGEVRRALDLHDISLAERNPLIAPGDEQHRIARVNNSLPVLVFHFELGHAQTRSVARSWHEPGGVEDRPLS